MIDRYNVEKLIEVQRADAIEAAAKDRLAGWCETGGSKQADRPPLAARLQRLALAGIRPLTASHRRRTAE
jgi:hypothetical protein